MFLISFNEEGHTFAGRSIVLPVCVASDKPGDDLIADANAALGRNVNRP